MRFSIRGLMITVAIFASLFFVIRSLYRHDPTIYHKDVSSWSFNSRPGGSNTWTYFPSHAAGYITYRDSDRDGKIDFREEMRGNRFVYSYDEDKDGFFDEESLREQGGRSYRRRYQIHERVPQTEKE